MQPGVERRADGQTAAIQALVTILRLHGPTHFFREKFSREVVRAERSNIDGEGFRPRLLLLLRSDIAVLGHFIQNPVPARSGGFCFSERMVVVRCLRKRREVGGLLDRKIFEFFVEIVERRRSNSVGTNPEIDLVEVKLENLLLRKRAFNSDGEDRLL